MSTKKALRALALGCLLGIAPVAAVATPAQAVLSGCSAQTIDLGNYAQATCSTVTTPSKFRAEALCESDSTGERKWKNGAWHYVSHEIAMTYCWSGWTIADSRVGKA